MIANAPHTPCRALVVDDNPEHVETLVKCLAGDGCEVLGVNYGINALQAFRIFQPHLVIYDDTMDGLLAWKFALEVRRSTFAFFDWNPRPYLVALACDPTPLQRALCMETGFDEYLKKPIESTDLSRFVERTTYYREYAR